MLKHLGLNDQVSLIRAADEARDARRWATAADAYRKVLDLNPVLAPIWVQYGHALKEGGDVKQAEAAYREAIRLVPQDADAQLQLGHALKLQGQTRAAAECYLTALKLDPTSLNARTELTQLGWSASALRKAVGGAAPNGGAGRVGTGLIALELTDLIDYLQRSRYPTGIQRVQLALAEAIHGLLDEASLLFVYFAHRQDEWIEIDRRQVAALVELVQDASRSDAAWQAEAGRILGEILSGAPLGFPQGCFLVNPGTSWGNINCFLALRDAKRRASIRYVPLVHDCIPLLMPEYCNSGLVKDFINWITHVMSHADFVLANSENTKRDFLDVAAKLEVTAPGVEVIRLNGEFNSRSNGNAEWAGAEAFLQGNNLDVEDFVLLVSTIEPRKNHAIALSAWSRLLKSDDVKNIPRLVCVGSAGWMNEDFYNRLDRDPTLRERVLILTDISDQALSLLYDKCLFTLFPSLYEGWGLPITEALAHGKVPLVSRASSHVEAGGDLAVYFDLRSEADFYDKLVGLIQDRAARQLREARITASSPLRPWREIGEQIADLVKRFPASMPATHRKGEPTEIVFGHYYAFARNAADRLSDCRHSGEPYRLGMGWHAPEPWGSWIKDESADIGFTLPRHAREDVIVYLHLVGATSCDIKARMDVLGSSWSRQITLPAETEQWQTIAIRRQAPDRTSIVIRIRCENAVDFAEMTSGIDRRRASIGVLGFYVCDANDTAQRQNILEALATGSRDHIARRFGSIAVL